MNFLVKEISFIEFQETQELLDGFKNAKRMVIVVGAGISTSSGIPDFRGTYKIEDEEEKLSQESVTLSPSSSNCKENESPKKTKKKGKKPKLIKNEIQEIENGSILVLNGEGNGQEEEEEGDKELKMLNAKQSKSGLGVNLRQKHLGRELLDARVFNIQGKMEESFRYISKMYDLAMDARPSETHKFLKRLDDNNKLVRIYSQNIDHLEERVGLLTGLTGREIVIPLHGTLLKVVCTVCKYRYDFKEYQKDYELGKAPLCPNCEEWKEVRGIAGKREQRTGTLRPDIVLYNESHPSGDMISHIVNKDILKRPDFLMIMGTSLGIPGCKSLVKSMSKAVHHEGGVTVFVNRTRIALGELSKYIDFQVLADTDDVVSIFSNILSTHRKRTYNRSIGKNFRFF